MSQEDVRILLLSLGGEASVEELSRLAQEQYPNRSLHAYLGERLKAMQKKGIVEKSVDDAQIWILTEKGAKNRVGGFHISDINELVDQSDLSKYNIEISNIVGSVKIGSRLILEDLATQLPNSEYNPETSPSLVYRPTSGSVTILVHSTGRLSITGSKNTDEIVSGTKELINSVTNLDLNPKKMVEKISIDNVVARSNFDRELDLAALAVGLKLENVEYEPEQFPGLIYRTDVNPTVLIFNSGKCVITGPKTYAQVLDSYIEVVDKMSDIGVEF